MLETETQFVIQQHHTPEGVHWDLMLEKNEVLWTWRLDCPPSEIGTESIAAERIFDHPLRFLTYEGPVQNATGMVHIADKGNFQLMESGDTLLIFRLEGRILSGQFSLNHQEDQNWLFLRIAD